MNTNKDKNYFLPSILVQLLGLIVSCLGLLALIGWMTELNTLASYSLGWKPMAPSSAIFFMLLGSTISLYERYPDNRIVYLHGIGASTFCILITFIILIMSSKSFFWDAEHVMFKINDIPTNIRSGHMSLFSASIFLLSGISFLLQIFPVKQNWRLIMSMGISGLIVFCGSALTFNYIFKNQGLYDGSINHPSLPSSIAFIAIGVALAIQSGLELLKKQHKRFDHEKLEVAEALMASEDRYRNLFNQANEGLMIMTLDGRISEANHSFAEMHGYTLNELKDIDIRSLDVLKEKTMEEHSEIVNRVKAGEIVRFEVEHFHKSGQIIFLNVTTSIIKIGEEKFYMAFHQDITERKQVEQEMQKRVNELSVLLKCSQSLSSSLELATVFQATTDSITELMDLQSAAIYTLEEEMLYLRATSPELPPQFPEEFRYASLNDHPHIKKALTTGAPVFVPDTANADFTTAERTVSNQRGLGSILYLPLKVKSQVIGTLIVSKVGAPRTLTTSEINLCLTLASLGAMAFNNAQLYQQAQLEIAERKNTETLLIESKEKAEEMNRVKSSFFNNMSHELRTPMIGILGYAELLQHDPYDTVVKKFARIIYSGGQRLMETLNLILDMSRIEAGKLTTNIVKSDIIPIIKEVLVLLNETAVRKSLYLKPQLEYESLIIDTDPMIFRQIINNLVNNALKYTLEGGVKVSLFTETQNAQIFIVMKVSDTGIGISDENKDLIWEEFRQVSEGKGRSFEGSGLGLSITKKFVELLQGDITVESKLEEGSTFTLRLPVSIFNVYDEILKEDQVQSSIKKAFLVQGESLPEVLYVENDEVAVSLTKILLKDICVIDRAKNSEEAIEKATFRNYSAILMDINLGRGADGVETTKHIRQIEKYSHTPIIAITAYAAESEMDEFLAAGCSHYLSKPYQNSQLINMMNEILKINK